MNDKDVEFLAIWLHSAARREGQLDTFRRVIRLAAEDAAQWYQDDDEVGIRELIGRFAAEVDDLERRSVDDEKMDITPLEFPAVVRGHGTKLADEEKTERVHIHVLKKNAKGLPYSDGEPTPITLVVGGRKYEAHLRSRANAPWVWVSPDLQSAGETVRLAHVLKEYGIEKNQPVTLRLEGSELSVHIA